MYFNSLIHTNTDGLWRYHGWFNQDSQSWYLNLDHHLVLRTIDSTLIHVLQVSLGCCTFSKSMTGKWSHGTEHRLSSPTLLAGHRLQGSIPLQGPPAINLCYHLLGSD